MNDIELTYTKSTIATEDCTQAFREFNATINAFKNRYHPVVWFILRIFYGK